MALSEDQIIDLFNEACRETFNGLERFRYFARAIEAEVRKQDETLIRQLVGALEDFDDAGPLGEGWKSAPLLSLLASARARLEHSTQACK